MKLEELFDLSLYEQMLAEDYIRERPHKEYPLRILNYSESAAYERNWNEVTINSRGLIVSEDNEVIARPFPKFFNLGETAVPQFVVTGQPAQIFEKLDGSLGILYHYAGRWHVATRGSFHSDQAEWATGFIQASGFDLTAGLTTHLVEIIYPENRIVVNYGDRADLVYLASLDIETGADVNLLGGWPFGTTRRYSDTEVQDVTNMVHQDDFKGEEGVVMVWPKPGQPSFRLKVKRADYVEMHRIVTGMTARKVWELCRDDVYVETIIQMGVPEEWADWVRNKYQEILSAHDSIVESANKRFVKLMADPHLRDETGEVVDRKRFAKAAKRYDHPGLLFSLLDGKSIDAKAWDMVYPPHEVPFGELV